MRVISSITASALVTLFSLHGYSIRFDESVAVPRLRLMHVGLVSHIYLLGRDQDGGSVVLLFTSADRAQIDYRDLEAWNRKHLIGRLRRTDEGNAEVDWAISIDRGVTEAHLMASLAAWLSSILSNFVDFCDSVNARSL
jgi:Putative bacterial sensory transduction regulator